MPSREELFELLDAVKDPEVPVISIVELGIVRDAVATLVYDRTRRSPLVVPVLLGD